MPNKHDPSIALGNGDRRGPRPIAKEAANRVTLPGANQQTQFSATSHQGRGGRQRTLELLDGAHGHDVRDILPLLSAAGEHVSAIELQRP